MGGGGEVDRGTWTFRMVALLASAWEEAGLGGNTSYM